MKVALNVIVSVAYGGKVDIIYLFPCLSSHVYCQVILQSS